MTDIVLDLHTPQDGSPDTKQELAAAIHPYFKLRDELLVHDGHHFQRTAMSHTSGIRPRIRAKVHESHIGVQSCLRRAPAGHK